MQRFLILFFISVICTGVQFAGADSVVVFNEIMYHPRTNEDQLEWVEIYNQMSVDVDLTGWKIEGGIDFSFPDGTIIQSGDYIVDEIIYFDRTSWSDQADGSGQRSGTCISNSSSSNLVG